MTRKRKIFIVDDDHEIIELMTALLEDRGFEVSSSVAGVYAISQIVAQRPDCVLIDLMMAELDGLELTGELRAHEALANTKLVMVSAKGEAHWVQRARDAGMDGYITKPLDPDRFADQVEEFI